VTTAGVISESATPTPVSRATWPGRQPPPPLQQRRAHPRRVGHSPLPF
jgi:hypothetical protein